MGTDIWQEIEELNQEFVRLGISQSVDYEKYYLYSLITHSTAIEGSTLTELDTQLLFDEGVTAKRNSPLEESKEPPITLYTLPVVRIRAAFNFCKKTGVISAFCALSSLASSYAFFKSSFIR